MSGDPGHFDLHSDQSEAMRFIGVDGCRDGWFCVTLDASHGWSFDIVPDATALAGYVHNASSVLIDIPIGLCERGPDGRLCDSQVRRLLGRARGPSVFPAPARQTLSARDYRSALAINRQAVGRGLSRQAWGIVPKIRDIDDLLQLHHALRAIMKECHPELCFWALNDRVPMPHNKKTAAGQHDRLALLARHFTDCALLYRQATARYLRRQVARDDIIDAMVCAVTARLGYPHYRTVPQHPPRDSRGLPMQIVYAENG